MLKYLLSPTHIASASAVDSQRPLGEIPKNWFRDLWEVLDLKRASRGFRSRARGPVKNIITSTAGRTTACGGATHLESDLFRWDNAYNIESCVAFAYVERRRLLNYTYCEPRKCTSERDAYRGDDENIKERPLESCGAWGLAWNEM